MLAWLLHNTVYAAALAAVVALVGRSKRIGPALRHALWVLVLLRLLWPPGLVNWPWTVPLPETAPPAATAEVAETAVIQEEAVSIGMLDGIEVRQVMPAEAEVTVELPPAVVEKPIDWRAAGWWSLAGIWALGAAVIVVQHLRGLVQLLRVLRSSQPAPPAVIRRVSEMAGKLGIGPPNVRIVAGLGSPLVAGLLRPVLLWPKELQHRLTEDGLRAVLIHELAHLRRRDHWVRWLEMAAACVWWWNPLFRLARRRVRQYAELACDAWVLTVLPRARRAYAEALLSVCESVARTPEPAPALGVNGDPSDFQRRLTMIMRESVSCRVPRRALLALGIVALLSVPSWTLGEPPAAGDDEASTAALQQFENTLNEMDDLLPDVLRLDVESIKNQPDRDAKLADLEAQIQALLKEIQALKAHRAGEKPRPLYAAEMARVQEAMKKKQAELEANRRKAQEKKLVDLMHEKAAAARAALVPKANEIVLYRVIYPLKQSRGEALARFLKEAVQGAMLECKVEGDKITITASPEHQNVIARLVQLINDLPSQAK